MTLQKGLGQTVQPQTGIYSNREAIAYDRDEVACFKGPHVHVEYDTQSGVREKRAGSLYVDFEKALSAFDASQANLIRLERVREEMALIVPNGVAFFGSSPESRRYDELMWAFDEIVEALPAISGFRIAARPLELNDIAERRLDAQEIGEFEAQLGVEESIAKPDQEIARYRHLLDASRRSLIRDRVLRLVPEITSLVDALARRAPAPTEAVADEDWDALQENVRQLARLAGPQLARSKAWGDLHRHLRFGQGQDLRDIARVDWPAIRGAITSSLYTDYEPIPVPVADLGDVANDPPAGPVATALHWARLSDDEFERLLFILIGDSTGYENAQWLTRTNAPDRGRDLSVHRIRSDPLSGTVRERVIVQARHRLNHSVRLDDVSGLVGQMRLWEPPTVDALIIATSGRFTTDAVDWIERHNRDVGRPRIEMWPESHLEKLLAERPHLAATMNMH